MIQLKKLPPMEVITRNLLIADLATVPGEMVSKVAPNLCIDMEHQIKGDDGKIVTKTTKVVDWGKILFHTSTNKLEFIMSLFQRKDKKEITPQELKEMEDAAKDIFYSLGGNREPAKKDKENEV